MKSIMIKILSLLCLFLSVFIVSACDSGERGVSSDTPASLSRYPLHAEPAEDEEKSVDVSYWLTAEGHDITLDGLTAHLSGNRDGYYRSAVVYFAMPPQGRLYDDTTSLEDFVVLWESPVLTTQPTPGAIGDDFDYSLYANKTGFMTCDFTDNMSVIKKVDVQNGKLIKESTGGKPVRITFPDSAFPAQSGVIDVYVLIRYSDPVFPERLAERLLEKGHEQITEEQINSAIAAVPQEKLCIPNPMWCVTVNYVKEDGKVVVSCE